MNSNNESLPLVSVCCITYNHQKYIGAALEGILMQQTDFPIEIIVHDDASKDDTPAIIQNYADKDARIIPILRKTNLKSTGVAIYPLLFKRVRGKYIAICDGDDYWTDSNKLQMQIDLMESNPQVSFCYSKALVRFENNNTSVIQPDVSRDTGVIKFTDSLTNYEALPASTIVFRNTRFVDDEAIMKVYNATSRGDYVLRFILGDVGDFLFLNEVTTVYRKHPKGVTQTFTTDIDQLFNGLETRRNLNRLYNGKYDDFLSQYPQEAYKLLFYAYARKRSILPSFRYFIKALYKTNGTFVSFKQGWIIFKSGVKLMITNA